jgi:Flp pilus assembly pilin Flp
MSLRKKTSLKSRQLGQGMTEYIVMTALVALAAIGAFQFFGESVRDATTAMSHELLGGDGSADVDTARADVATQQTADQVQRGLSSYGDNNQHQ